MLIFVTSESVIAVLLFLLFFVAFPLSGLPPDGKRLDEKLSEIVNSDCAVYAKDIGPVLRKLGRGIEHIISAASAPSAARPDETDDAKKIVPSRENARVKRNAKVAAFFKKRRALIGKYSLGTGRQTERKYAIWPATWRFKPRLFIGTLPFSEKRYASARESGVRLHVRGEH